MVQVEVAGPNLPQTIELVPNAIRDMAEWVLNTCAKGADHTGGFLTSDMSAMKDWIVDPKTNLDDSYCKYQLIAPYLLVLA